ncbi:MAG: VWA domain-containing protein [Salibacteraceae bacterium]
MAEWEFLHREFLWGLAVIPLLAAWHFWTHRKRTVTMGFSGLRFISGRGLKAQLIHVPMFLRLIALALIIVALARPQSTSSWQDIKTEGIDIVIALDISSSMLARDFKPNRLEVAKEVAIDFIKGRPNDRIGLVVFSGQSFTQCPLTTDHDVLINLLSEVKHGMIEDGTAIGMGLANAVNRLKESDAKSKVVILLTDGENTAGAIPPITAAEIAANFGVKVYTIGVGTYGQAPFPATDVFGNIVYQMAEVRIDEETLEKIAELTNGRYFRATDEETLRAIYQEIDQLEKTVIEETQYEKRSEEFFPLALAALAVLTLEWLTRKVYLNSAITDV